MARIVFHSTQAHQVTEHVPSLSHVLPATDRVPTPVAVAAVGGRRLSGLVARLRSPWPDCLRGLAQFRTALSGARPIPWEQGVSALHAAERALQTGAIELPAEVQAMKYESTATALYLDDHMSDGGQDPLARAVIVAAGLGVVLQTDVADEYQVLGSIERAVARMMRYGADTLRALPYAQRMDLQRVAMAALGGDAMIPLSEVFPALDALSRCERPAAEVVVEAGAGDRVRIDLPRAVFEGPYANARDATMRAFRRGYVEAVLERYDGNVSAAARAAGLDRSNFRRLRQDELPES